jgi:hypothetical protein
MSKLMRYYRLTLSAKLKLNCIITAFICYIRYTKEIQNLSAMLEYFFVDWQRC